MKIEMLIPIIDFYKIKTNKERMFLILIPAFVGMIYILSINFFNAGCSFNFDLFFNDLLNAIITVMALFISFNMAYLTILITSNSENVIELKNRTSRIYEINKKPVFLFQVLLIEITYTIIVEIAILIFAFILKFLVVISSFQVNKIYILILIILITHTVMLIMRNLKNIYLTFWKSN